jgi:3-isopropylmalate dehydrogenase
MFEPIGGSAPKYTGQGKINPLAAICAAQMMLEYLNEEKAASLLMDAIKDTVKKLKSLEAGRMGYSTQEIGDMVASYIEQNG